MTALPRGEIHIWLIPLRGGLDAALLSPDELHRAARIRVPEARAAFVAARSALRRILSGYVQRPAAGLCFVYGPAGKPSLPGADLHFNLSHSHGLAVLAVSRDLEIGADVEKIRPLPWRDAIASRFFSPEECAALHAAVPLERDGAFFRIWTRKEAWLKARGLGLAGLPESPGPEWWLHSFEPAPGYAAAVASPEPPAALNICSFDNT